MSAIYLQQGDYINSADGNINSYASDYRSEKHSFEMYAAVYNEDGILQSVRKNEADGQFVLDEQGYYTVKIFFWNNTDPVYNLIEKR